MDRIGKPVLLPPRNDRAVIDVEIVNRVVIKKWNGTAYERVFADGTVRVTIDLAELAHKLARKAMSNTSRKAKSGEATAKVTRFVVTLDERGGAGAGL